MRVNQEIRKFNIGVAGTLALLCNFVVADDNASPDTIAAWVQLTANGAQARAIVMGDCPEIQLDNRPVRMRVRAEATAKHPNTVCEIDLRRGLKSIVLGDQKLPTPVKYPHRVVVVGDTGCRVSDKHGLYQGCNNNSVWPFAQVARKIAKTRPDLIVHTGDYIYRESACPPGNNGCAGTPHGDNMETWLADWLVPAMPVFKTATLLPVRGNHETCERAGTGWFRYLGPRENPDQCLDSTNSWVADLGHTQIGVIDSANLEDSDDNPLTDHFVEQLTDLDAMLGRNSWLVAHHPFWGLGADDDTGELKEFTEVLQDAVDEAGLPASTRLLLGSHIHLVEVLNFDSDRPPQIVIGNGGTELVPRVAFPDEIDGAIAKATEPETKAPHSVVPTAGVEAAARQTVPVSTKLAPNLFSVIANPSQVQPPAAARQAGTPD
jgi:hypothetical protein